MENDQKQNSKLVQLFDEMLDNNEIEFGIDLVSNHGTLLAFVTLMSYPLFIKGFRIMESSRLNSNGEAISLLPPCLVSNKDRTSYTRIFFIGDLTIWNKLQSKAIQAYYKKKKDSYSGTNKSNGTFTKEDEDWINKNVHE